MIRIESDKMSYDILVPTDIEEITKEDIDAILAGVVVPQYYAVVALIYKERLYSVVSNVKNNKTTMVKCVPILAKLHKGETNANGCELMDKLIIPTSSLERANLITIPQNILDPTAVGRYCNYDDALVRAIVTGSYFNDGSTSDMAARELAPDCYFIDFRMIPVNEIIGGYKKDITPECPFKVPKEPATAEGEASPLLN